MCFKVISGLLHRRLGKGSAYLVTQQVNVRTWIGDPSASIFSPAAIGYRSSLRTSKAFRECRSVFLLSLPSPPRPAHHHILKGHDIPHQQQQISRSFKGARYLRMRRSRVHKVPPFPNTSREASSSPYPQVERYLYRLTHDIASAGESWQCRPSFKFRCFLSWLDGDFILRMSFKFWNDDARKLNFFLSPLSITYFSPLTLVSLGIFKAKLISHLYLGKYEV